MAFPTAAGSLTLPACQRATVRASSDVRLFQDQLYRQGERFLRIVRLDRYEVEFKTMAGDPKGEGTLAVLPKKEFCRHLKGMKLVDSADKSAEQP